jgi:hypothetical protein
MTPCKALPAAVLYHSWTGQSIRGEGYADTGNINRVHTVTASVGVPDGNPSLERPFLVDWWHLNSEGRINTPPSFYSDRPRRAPCQRRETRARGPGRAPQCAAPCMPSPGGIRQ